MDWGRCGGVDGGDAGGDGGEVASYWLGPRRLTFLYGSCCGQADERGEDEIGNLHSDDFDGELRADGGVEWVREGWRGR